MFDDMVYELRRKQVEQIEALLLALPVGSTLCVHELGLDSDLESDTYKILTETHVIGPGETCDAKIQRTQYGPKPADFPSKTISP